MEILLGNITIIMTILGVIAFIVSLITEVTKNISFLAKIPTDLQVIVLSMVLCMLAYLSYTSYTNTAVLWYFITGSIIASFIVSFVAMYGWDKLTILYSRFKK